MFDGKEICFRTKAIALLLLSMVLHSSAYSMGGGRLHTVLPKMRSYITTLKQSLPQKFMAGVAAVTIACSASSCTVENVQEDAQISVSADKIVVLSGHDRSISLDEMTAAIEQADGAQFGIIRSADEFENQQLQELTTLLQTDDKVLLKLSQGDVLINNSGAQLLEIKLPESEGLIADGSPIALGISLGAAILLTGFFAYGTAILYSEKDWQTLLEGLLIGVFVVPIAGAGIYKLLVIL